ncbi:Glycosyltransferase, GT2 family [Noviherbaspirillum humi]|uniref:Glycosyltransferase, GT2 family n=1 Tax=Noviherbaspirillum humi TaxID=1688639 RepID=A0A239CUQ1_9BURK|nr:glycosyltransferase [Noviherbaspirillum humi]SNS23592.1 Glycosyltransferase, GT2 family [Noviherbaspirillum humi]
MIYDTFIFFNELDLLELRLNVLDKHVDYFVLVEATETFQGAPKPLHFADNKDRFSKFLHKIVYVVVDDMPRGAAPFDREYHQRDCILRGLLNCRPDDFVLLSDVDEIPNPERIPATLQDGLPIVFEQPLFYYKLNRKCVQMESLPWSVLTHYGNLGQPSQLRRTVVKLQSEILSRKVITDGFQIIKDGGWHFSYLGSPENIVKKIEAFSHAEYNRPEFKNIGTLADCISKGRDLFGRELIFVTVDIEELPQYVRNNREKYEAMHYLESATQTTSLGEISHTLDILFDQYSRYRACAELLLRLGATSQSRILDVGSGSACLLSEFLPGFDISYVDPLINTLPSKKSNQFGYQIDEVADKLGLFDFVVAIDVLEHVPPQFREGFTTTLTALATKSVVLAFPYADEQFPVNVDQAINEDYAYINEQSYSWLEEHDTYGLPNVQNLQSGFASRGMDAGFFYHGYAPWLKELLSYVINVNDIAAARELGYQASREFNQKLYDYDFNQPAYRVFLVASKSVLPSGWKPAEKPIDSAAEQQFEAIMHKAYLRLYAQLQATEREMLEAKSSASASAAERERALAEREAALAQADALRKQYEQANELIAQMRRSNSWRLTKPLRFAARLKRYGLGLDDRRALGQVVRKAYRRMPLPDAARNGLRWLYHRHLKRLLTPHSRQFANLPFTLPSLVPAARNDALPDYVMWGVIDWHFRFQRPQQLATALAASGRRVVYVSPAFVPDGRAGFDLEQLDATGRLFQVKLFVSTAPTIYSQAPTAQELGQIQASLGALLEWLNPRQIESVVQHPFWYEAAMALPNSRVVYDCMDHHDGFGNNATEISVLENALIKHADLTITTSDWLDREAEKLTERRALIRNAGDYAHFSKAPATVYRDPESRKVIGYYGAIAEWFDQDLVKAVARAFPDCCILLIGADSVNAQRRLGKLANVKFTGEVSYQDLPSYLYGFDVCMLPFKIIPLTLATNPVKVYEYLSAGKPVVSVDLPEIAQCEGLVRVGTTPDEFVRHLAAELAGEPSQEQEARRRSFAAGQTWEHRVSQLIADVEGKKDEPLVSIIVVTYNNLALTQACLASIDAYSDYPNLEIIVVDNASSDGSPAYLSDWVKGASNRKLILNADNLGFAAGNNVGLAAASGEYLVLLNNDTYVTPGWVRTMMRHLQLNPEIGLIGPVTNNIGNEAKIEIAYDDMQQMLRKSAAHTRRHIGKTFRLHTAAFFCVMMPRVVYQQVGPLDEAFGRGFFEDDDYCRRVEQLGKEIACAEDVFIHHHLSASFNKLKSKERQALFDQNRVLYEAKWGKWTPHSYRDAGQSAPAENSLSDSRHAHSK